MSDEPPWRFKLPDRYVITPINRLPGELSPITRQIMDAQQRQIIAYYHNLFYNQETPMPFPNETTAYGEANPQPIQPGVGQSIDYTLDRLALMLHRLETVHRMFIGSQPVSADSGNIVGMPEGLLERCSLLTSRVEQCLAVVEMIRACVDGSS